jgi:hypothetical protein
MDWNALGDWMWQTLLDLALLAPLGTLMTVVIAYIAYVQRSTADRLTLQQKTEADNRNAWWSRVQWVIDAGLSDDRQRRTAGMVAIEQLPTNFPESRGIHTTRITPISRVLGSHGRYSGFPAVVPTRNIAGPQTVKYSMSARRFRVLRPS